LHAADLALEPLKLLELLRRLVLRKEIPLALLLLLLEALERLEPPANRDPVGQRAAQPAGVHVELAAALGLAANDVLGLLLGTDEKNVLATGRKAADELVRRLQHRDRLLQVQDVDAIALREDVALHLRVPAVLLVTEVDACLEERLQADGLVSSLCTRHENLSCVGSSALIIPIANPSGHTATSHNACSIKGLARRQTRQKVYHAQESDRGT